MKIIFFSSLPPPIGGVTKSVENLLSALKEKPVDIAVVRNFLTWKPFFSRYDIAHVHYTKSWKRLFGLVLGKLISKKVIFTLHSNDYSNDKLNHISAKIADGVILLNKSAEDKYKHMFKKTVILGSMFAEGVNQNIIKDKKYINRLENKIYLLVYAFDKVYRDSKDVYGVDFILNNLNKLNDKYIIVLLDMKGAYKDEVRNIDENSLLYLDYEVDFLSLLSEVDIYVRPTSTDGASVALQEALILGKNVLASNSVERPNEVVLYEYGNFVDFNNQLRNMNINSTDFIPNSIDDYLKFCTTLIEERINF